MSNRFFVEAGQISGDSISIVGEELTHLQRVLRLQVGATVVVCDGTGKEYQAVLREVGRELALAEIISAADSVVEPRLRITLVQALPKADKMDFIVQKGTELGIHEFLPVITERTIVRLRPDKAQRRVERWQRIAQEAAKQSQRAVIPKVGMPVTWQEGLSKYKEKHGAILGLFPWESARGKHLRDVLLQAWGPSDGRYPLEAWICIGPEGGWSPEEAKAAELAHLIPLSLGSRILRTETAGMVVAALVLYASGDLG
ncbi:MAG: 16S rRNA (uracil(1498)-N(3))-methyltransferase [Firmicutes bacterium]|nr:16S rRNA (uracil(1498)-N(3))-methyltransferase [Bacillota bacterium]